MEQQITWQDVIDLADKVLAELAELMNTDTQHGIVYQQRMAVMMERRQQAIIMKRQEELEGEKQ